MFKAERANEHLRQSLQDRQYFSLHAAFDYMDARRQGYLEEDDIRRIMVENGFFATDREVNALMNRLDIQNKRQI